MKRNALLASAVLTLAACGGSEVALQPDPDAAPTFCPFAFAPGEDVCGTKWPLPPELARAAVPTYAALTTLLARNARIATELETHCMQIANTLGTSAAASGEPSVERTRRACDAAQRALGGVAAETSLRLVLDAPTCRAVARSAPACVVPVASRERIACEGRVDAGDGRDLSALTPDVDGLLALRAELEDALDLLGIVNRDFTTLTALPACTQPALATTTRAASDLAALLGATSAVLRFEGD